MPFVFRKWYEENKDKLSEKRRSRYQTDPAYREAAKKRAAEARAARAHVEPPEGMLSLSQAADELGTSA
ncbi:hypothetical protein ACXWOC_11470, partial [Streptococcus pyogenes]